jgi:hypothetical protein
MLIDMTDQGRDRELIFDRVSQVLAPSWSPDGTSIAFSALAGGLTDLFVADAATGKLQRLTDDPFADLQPAWSHDGTSIAFATERYSSDLATFRFGRPRLAVMDIRTHEVRQASFGDGVELNPQWSGDDQELYFVSNRTGLYNVFRTAADTFAPEQITNVETGVGSITPTSPMLSMSADGSLLALTVYERGRPRLATISTDQLTTVAAKAAEAPVDGVTPGVIDAYLADVSTGLPDPSTLFTHDYISKMTLEGLGQPYLSSGGGPFGTFVRGGGALLFGDMLGERRLGAAVQIGNHLRDAAFVFRYLNQERRWNWGALGELEPGIVRYQRTEAIEYEGQPAILKQADYLQRMQLRTAAVVAYPFNRGTRIEFTAGVRHAAYRRDLRSQINSVETGKVLATEAVESRGGLPTTVAEVTTSLIHDTTMFGPTGPIVGTRYRFEVAPAIGQLSYTTVTADMRRYFMPLRPYTIAVRLLHTARYGSDGGDPRLLSSFLGSSYFVRGHRQDMYYCRPDATRVCGDDLLGHRLLVGNLEIRVPISGITSRQIDYSWFPADAFAFIDGGMIHGHDRSSTISAFGAGLRANAAGFPIEIAAIRALDGPRPRWQFDLGFRVGF